MKVKTLIEMLQTVDPDLDVCLFQEDDELPAMLLEDVNVWSGQHQEDTGPKMVFKTKSGIFLGLGGFEEIYDSFQLVKEVYP